MDHFDFAVLGAGPTALTVFNHLKWNNKGVKGVLIVEKDSEEGAFSKGVKSANSIIPKLPSLRQTSIEICYQTIKMKKISEILLKEMYDSYPCYIGKSNIGFRYCRSKEEFFKLQSIKNFFSNSGAGITDLTANFLKNQNIKNVNKELLFPFEEHVWDVNLFRNLFLAKIGEDSIWTAQKVQYIGSKDSLAHLSIYDVNGDVKKISVGKVIVCKGVGNICFEDEVKLVESLGVANQMTFQVLKYYKCIYKPEIILPETITSITIPDDGIYFTNEQAQELSILYNLNSGLCSNYGCNKDLLEKDKDILSKYVFDKYPSISANLIRDFMCQMVVDANAYQGDVEKHFRFIISKSVNSNIRYINLPYFSVVAAALNNLSFDLNKL